MKTIIRAGQASDAEQIINLLKRLDKETHFMNREPGEFHFTVEQEIDFLNNTEKSNTSLFLIAERNNKIIGSIGLEGSSLIKYCHVCSLGMGVLKEYWGKGVGSELLHAAIVWAKENQMIRIELNVVETNERAIALYQKYGFIDEGTSVKGIKIDDKYYGVKKMGLIL